MHIAHKKDFVIRNWLTRSDLDIYSRRFVLEADEARTYLHFSGVVQTGGVLQVYFDKEPENAVTGEDYFWFQYGPFSRIDDYDTGIALDFTLHKDEIFKGRLVFELIYSINAYACGVNLIAKSE